MTIEQEVQELMQAPVEATSMAMLARLSGSEQLTLGQTVEIAMA